MKNHINTSATITANQCACQKPAWTADTTPVVELLAFTGIVTMLPNVAHRYATIVTREPQNRYFLIAFRWTISTPMFSGTSIPSRARMTRPKNVQLLPCGTQLCTPENEFADLWPPISQRTPARPIGKTAPPWKTTTRLA